MSPIQLLTRSVASTDEQARPGYATTPNESVEPVLQDAYDWDRIRANAGDLYFINSITDPYGCDADQGRLMFMHLGGTQIVRSDGHFGDHDQRYDTFELVDRLIR